MLTQETLEKLRRMRLGAMADALQAQQRAPEIHELSLTGNGRPGGTGGWPACSRRPGSGCWPPRRTSTTARPGGSTSPCSGCSSAATGSGTAATYCSPAPPGSGRPSSPAP